MSFDRYFIISMPTLNWIGKEAVVNHDKEVPFRLLRKVKSSSVGDNSQNLIIHGDNLEALKALMPYYVGKIKCIYIDPPYNNGNGRNFWFRKFCNKHNLAKEIYPKQRRKIFFFNPRFYCLLWKKY